MSEASRARRQFLRNRLEELEGKYGVERGPPPPGLSADPSWGPLGSLARSQLSAEEYDRIVAHDQQIAALERQRQAMDGSPAMDVAATSLSTAPEDAQPSQPVEVWRHAAG